MDGPAERIEVRLLGPFEVLVAGRPVDVSRGRNQALLTVLALSAGRPVQAQVLAERVWGTDLPTDPRGSLYTAVGRLRRVLGAGAISGIGGGYCLRVEPDQVDALHFGQLVAQAGRAAEPGAELVLLRQALALWAGEPVALHSSRWLTGVELPRLLELYLVAVERRVDLEAGANPPAHLVAELRSLTEAHPLRESLWLRLMRALAVAGRIADALAAYQTVRELLADELGADPGPELRRLHADLLAGITPVSVPEQVVPRQLPAAVPGFTGRSGVLARLDELHGRSGHDGSLLVLHGQGGVGKTTLAAHWAAANGDDFPAGQLFVDLRGFGPGEPVEPADALLTMLRGLGVPDQRIPIGTEDRTSLLRTTCAGRRLLVVLDNARDVTQVRPLLPGAGTTVIVTSRNQLRGLAARERATRIALEPLAPEEAGEMLAERLRMLTVDYDLRTLTELATLCGHLPLALAVAAERAGRYPGSPLGELVDQLTVERLGVLETGDDLTTNLRAVMSWSYRALTDEEGRLLRLLGVQPIADLDARAVAALMADSTENVLPLLDRLVDRHLVEYSATGRYGMHDLIRVYASEQSAAEDPDHVREVAVRRLDSWYVQTAMNARRALKGPMAIIEADPPEPGAEPVEIGDHHEAMLWFGAERSASVALIAAAAKAGRHRTASRLSHALIRYLDILRSPLEAIAVADIAVGAARAGADQPAEAALLHQLGTRYRQIRRPDEATVRLRAALRLYRRAGHRQGECQVLGDLGVTYGDLGRLDKAVELIEAQLALARELGLSYHANLALNNLASNYRRTGRLDAAARVGRQAADGYRADGESMGLSMALDTLGAVHLEQGRPEDAAVCLEEALAITRDLGNRWGEAVVLRNLAIACEQAGRPEQARRLVRDALVIVDEHELADSADLRRAELVELVGRLGRSEQLGELFADGEDGEEAEGQAGEDQYGGPDPVDPQRHRQVAGVHPPQQGRVEEHHRAGGAG